MSAGKPHPKPENGLTDSVVKGIADAIRGIRYGSVEIIIHEGRIVQIEKRQKLRPDADGKVPLD